MEQGNGQGLRVEPWVIEYLKGSDFLNDKLVLRGQLGRREYLAVASVIEAVGGKWDRKAKAHVFADEDAATALDPVLRTGWVRNKQAELGQFWTPAPIAQRVIELAEIRPGDKVLEPSAGQGILAKCAMVAGASHVDCVEIDGALKQEHLVPFAPKIRTVEADFLQLKPADNAWQPYRVCVMNPPFARQADIRHVLHATRFVAQGGRLVAIMSQGTRFRENALARQFRDMLQRWGGHFIDLPEGAFKESGTMVRACIAVMDVRPIWSLEGRADLGLKA